MYSPLNNERRSVYVIGDNESTARALFETAIRDIADRSIALTPRYGRGERESREPPAGR